MEKSRVLELCKDLNETTLFECRVESSKKAGSLMFSLQEMFLGSSSTISTGKSGRQIRKVYCSNDGCHAEYNPSTKVFKFSRVPLLKTEALKTTYKEASVPKKKKSVSVADFDIEKNIIREQYSSRGGGVEIKLDDLGAGFKGEKMSAYQNYLGGGMLGRVASNNTIVAHNKEEMHSEVRPMLDELETRLRDYYFKATNMEGSIEANQALPVSAY